MRPTRQQLQRAGDWAKEQPSGAWNPLPFDTHCKWDSVDTLFAVKTATGRILTGTYKAFRPVNMEWIGYQSKYGRPLYWLQVDSTIFADAAK